MFKPPYVPFSYFVERLATSYERSSAFNTRFCYSKLKQIVNKIFPMKQIRMHPLLKVMPALFFILGISHFVKTFVTYRNTLIKNAMSISEGTSIIG